MLTALMATLPPPVWDIVGAYALSAEEGLAAAESDAGVLEWVMRALRPTARQTLPALIRACRAGRGEFAVAMMKLIPREAAMAGDCGALLGACEGGHTQLVFDIVKELKMTHAEVCSSGALPRACLFGHASLASRLASEHGATSDTARVHSWFVSSCHEGVAELVEWALARFNDIPHNLLTLGRDAAKRRGHGALVRLLDKSLAVSTTRAGTQ